MQAEGEVCKQKLRKSHKAFPSFLFPPSQGIRRQRNNGPVAPPIFFLSTLLSNFPFLKSLEYSEDCDSREDSMSLRPRLMQSKWVQPVKYKQLQQ